MKQKIYNFCIIMIFILGTYSLGNAQKASPPVMLGTSKDFVTAIKEKTGNVALRQSDSGLELKISASKSLNGKINYHKADSDNKEFIAGEIKGVSGSNFHFNVNNGSVEGNIILKNTKQAFKYSSDANGNVYVQEVDINGVVCIDYEHLPAASNTSGTAPAMLALAANDLQSLPGANGCVLLDFDGQYVSGTPWNSGNPINAAPSGMSDAAIQEAWELVSEDYRPFNVNITTNEAVFNTYSKTRRMRCIITPTNTAAPGSGGVAYIGSFNWNDDTPCWVFITSGKAGGEACSHEVGHTFGLGHDGRELSTGHEEYYGGQGDWAPIMGVGYYKNITQFSKGEYNSANNKEDDLSKITSSTYGVGYRNDDHGNGLSNATTLNISSTGSVSSSNNFGFIGSTSDVDVFSFNTGGGNIILNFTTVSRHSDLDILVRLYTETGTQIGLFNPTGLPSIVNANLSAGKYYVSVDGTGAGNPATDGYSDYASMGNYYISGTVPVGVVVTLRNPENPAGTVNGLDYKSYEGSWNNLPNFSSLTPVKTGTVSNYDISVRNRNDQFGFSFTGFVNVPSDGQYTFYTSSDDGSQLFIGSTLVVNNNGLHGVVEQSGTIGLKAGKHAVTVNFFEQGGGELLSVSYAGPGIGKQTVPSSALYRIPSATGIATFYQHCNFDPSGYAIGLNVGDYTTAQMAANGILNNDVSSLKVSSGYEVVLYDLDNFQGASQIFKADNSCLVANGINDWASSIRVRTITTTLNQIPTVSITSPSNGTTFNAPATITINANATDSDGTISKVEFYNGSSKLGEDASSPYSFTWSNVAASGYTIRAIAYDNTGAPSTPASINVTVNTVTTDNCGSTPQYLENNGYVAGSQVKNVSRKFQCKPWPYSGWCNQTAWAYAPGTGTYWTDAWSELGACSATVQAALSMTSTLTVTNPVSNDVTLNFENTISEYTDVIIFDSFGKEVLRSDKVKSGDKIDMAALSNGIYLIVTKTGTETVSKRVIKQ